MRILLVVDTLDVGGAERHAVDLAVVLQARGHEVTLACSAGGLLVTELAPAGIPLHVLLDGAVKRRLSPLYARRLHALIRSGAFDLVHAHLYASAAAASLATAGIAIPLVITEHSEATWQGSGARSVSRWMRRRAARVIAVSTAIGTRVAAEGVPLERISVIANAVTPAAEIAPAKQSDSPCIGVIARLQPEKGVDVFLRAARELARPFPRARFIIAGDGPLRPRLEADMVTLRLNDRVQFLGLVPAARNLLGNLDVLAVPSLSEGAPLVVLEGMMAGVPIVAAAAGGIPEQIQHEREGLLVPPGDWAALSAAIARLLADPFLARRLGIAAKERASRQFSHDAMVRQVEALYRRAVMPAPGVSTLAKPRVQDGNRLIGVGRRQE